jgi:hypothetical protein
MFTAATNVPIATIGRWTAYGGYAAILLKNLIFGAGSKNSWL